MNLELPCFSFEIHDSRDSCEHIRHASAEDITNIDALIVDSAEQRGQSFYTVTQRKAAIDHAFGNDSTLIEDGTYLLVESDGELHGCGGWSRRETLFGGDQIATRNPRLLDPASEAARIRAFFVSPHHARQGVASRLLAACERAALEEGFRVLELMATLPGVPFYAARDFIQTTDIVLELGPEVGPEKGKVPVPFVAMRKPLHMATRGVATAHTSPGGGRD